MNGGWRCALPIGALASAVVAWPGFAAVAVTDAHKELFLGEYRGAFQGLKASLTITPDLQFVYSQERGEVTRLSAVVKREGTLVVTADDTARAGGVRLRWKTKNAVAVQSPYGSGIRADGLGGGQQQLGTQFTLRRQGVQNRHKFTYSLTLPQSSEPTACNAEVRISYLQMHERIRVDTTVTNDQCAASSGEYVLKVRTRNDEGRQRTREFAETWSRKTDEPVETRRFYDMDGDSRLASVQVVTPRKTNCRCDTPPEYTQPSDNASETDGEEG